MLNSQAPYKLYVIHTVYKQKQIIQTFFVYFIQNAVLRRKKSSSGQGRSESKKKKFFFFLGSGPKIGSVGTWETDNQLDVPLHKMLIFLILTSSLALTSQ